MRPRPSMQDDSHMVAAVPQESVDPAMYEPPVQDYAEPVDDFEMPPVDGYYGKMLDDVIKQNPMPKGQHDWRKDASKKFKDMRAQLDRVREHIKQLERRAANV